MRNPTTTNDTQPRSPEVRATPPRRALWALTRTEFWLAILLVATSLSASALAQQQFTLDTPLVVTAVGLRVREAPGLAARILATVPRGSKGVVVDASPHWADGYWWWDIEYRSGVRGWSADGDAELIYLVIDQHPAAAEVIEPPPASPPTGATGATGAAGATGTRASDAASLSVVVIPSLMSALSLARHDLHVLMEGPETHRQVIPNVAPAFPVTVVFDGVAPGTYVVTAQHGGSRLQRTIEVRGRTLQVDFVMP